MAMLTILMLMGWMLWLGTSISMNSELEEYKGISSKYSKLQDEYSSIKSSYESLMKDYEELKKMYEVLRSVSWLSEDERIMITYELIEEYPLHKLKVNVTNVGNAPLRKVYIFVFKYADDNLIEWFYDTVYDLYMGETHTLTFILLEVTTAYKVLAVGSY